MRIWTLLILVGALPGCRFVALDQGLQAIGAAASIGVRVEGRLPGAAPVYTALVQELPGAVQVETYAVVPEDRGVRLHAEPGAYLLVAFQDQNRNALRDPGEPSALAGGPRALDLRPGTALPEITLVLTVAPRGEGAPGPWSADAVVLSDRLRSFGTVVSLDDPRFDHAAARQGVWEPDAFIRSGHPGLYLLQPYAPEKLPVVLVHGICGTPRDFAALARGLDTERIQPWVFYYPTAMGLEQLGDYLAVSIERLRARHGFRRVVLVAHSMGGLVAWSAVRNHLQNHASPYVAGLLTIASPLGGIQSAASGVAWAPVVMPSWVDLVPGSAFLSSLYRIDPGQVPPYRVVVAYDDGRSPRDEAASTGDGTVVRESQRHAAALRWADRVHAVRATHTAVMAHPDTARWLNAWLDERRGAD